MTHTKDKNVTEKIERIDQEISNLKEDRSFISIFLPSLASELDEFLERASRNYTQVLKRFAMSEVESTRDELDELYTRILDKRFLSLLETIETATEHIERTINNPLWLGERSAYLEVIARIRDEINGLTPDKQPEAISAITSAVEDINNLEKRLELDDRRVRVRLPFQIILWGLPIIVGIWISGKLTTIQNILVIVLLIFMAILSYSHIKFRFSSRLKSVRRLLSFYGKTKKTVLVIQILFLLFMFSVFFSTPLNNFIVESRMKIVNDIQPETIKRGDTMKFVYSVLYDHEIPAVGIKVWLKAPGILTQELIQEYNAMTKLKAEEGEF